MTEIFRQRNASRIVGTSLLIMLGLVVASILLLLQKNEVFRKSTIYYLEAEQSQLRGLRKSMDVRILGEPVGTVKDVAYVGSSNKVQLELEVKVPDDDRKNIIWENSRIVVARAFGIGEPYLEIERGVDMLGAIVSNTTERDFVRLRSQGALSRGVKIERLVAGSPAEKSRLSPGEYITSFNGMEIDGISDLTEAMRVVAPGDAIRLKIHGREQPVEAIAALVEPKRLEEGGTIIQFEPEEDAFQNLADKISLVQESIANVETNFVDTLDKTESDIDNSLKPTIQQYMMTGKSIENTSDRLRNETLKKIDSAVGTIDQSSETFGTEVKSVSDRVKKLFDEKADPAIESFGVAATKLGQTSDSLRKTTETVGKDAEKMIKELDAAAKTLNELLNQSRTIVDALESEAKSLPGTVSGINRTVDKADTVIDGISNHWLVRRSVDRSKAKKGQPTSRQTQPATTRRTGPIRKMFRGN